VSGQVFSPDDPARMVTYLGSTGHALWPYFWCDVADYQFDLQQMIFRGTITGSRITV